MLRIIECCHKKKLQRCTGRAYNQKKKFPKLRQIVTAIIKTLMSDAGVCNNKGSQKGLKRLQEIIKLITAGIGTNQISDAIY